MRTLFYENKIKDNNPITTTVDLLQQLDSCIKTICTECNTKQLIQDKDMDIKVLMKRFQQG